MADLPAALCGRFREFGGKATQIYLFLYPAYGLDDPFFGAIWIILAQIWDTCAAIVDATRRSPEVRRSELELDSGGAAARRAGPGRALGGSWEDPGRVPGGPRKLQFGALTRK